MSNLSSGLHRFVRGLTRNGDITVWGDARSMPYTEGQAVVGPGQVGPGPVPTEASSNLGRASQR